MKANGPGPLVLLTLVVSAAVYARTSLNPLQEPICAALDLTDNQISLLQGPALALPMAIAAVPLWSADRSTLARENIAGSRCPDAVRVDHHRVS